MPRSPAERAKALDYYYTRYRGRSSAKARAWRIKRLDAAMKMLGNKCRDCGHKDRRVLEFDHVWGVKKFDIGGSGRKWSVFVKELKKCELVCANCHRIRTHARIPRLQDDFVYIKPRRHPKFITANGLSLTKKQWAKRTGLPVTTIENRLRANWSHTDIVNTPKVVGSPKGWKSKSRCAPSQKSS